MALQGCYFTVMVQIVVQGVPFAYAWQELKDLFKPLGAVKADIVMGSDRRSKGWGTVLFDSESDAENAIKVQQPSAYLAQPCVCMPAFVATGNSNAAARLHIAKALHLCKAVASLADIFFAWCFASI